MDLIKEETKSPGLTDFQQGIIEKTIDFVKHNLEDAEGGHDWWHVYRVWKMAIQIAESENVDLFVVQLGALLHDIADPKFHSGNEEIGPAIAVQFLRANRLDNAIIQHIDQIIRNISFKNSIESKTFKSNEMDIIQDADRLDAIGAIGIARTFHYGGHKGFSIYNPLIKPKIYKNKQEYKNSEAPTVNHFYEKLLLLKDLMNTEKGKMIAEERHLFMENFLQQFFREWEGRQE